MSGTNTAGEVYVKCTNDVSMAVSNLVLSISSENVAPFEIGSNAAVTVTLAGESRLASLGKYTPAVHVPQTASLTITNLDSVVSLPDLDNITYRTNTVESVEEVEDEYGHITIVTNYVDIVTAETNYYDAVVSGALTATGSEHGAGIGGGYRESYGTIQIDGGVITAQGGYNASGIGSGCISEFMKDSVPIVLSGALNIRGGTVNATGGTYGAGIGGGNLHSGGTIAVLGGTVTARGGVGGAGIGGGWNARAKAIAISGGVVTATGGSSGGAGIGGGNNGLDVSGYDELRTVTISGGIVTAVGGSTGGAGIGSASYDRSGMKVTITGGTVSATGGSQGSLSYDSSDIGTGGRHQATPATLYPLTIRGASVHATRRTASRECVEPAPSNGTRRVWCVTVATSKTNEHVKVEHLDGFSDSSEIYADAEGKIYLWLPNGTYIFYVGGKPRTARVNGADTTATEWLTGVMADGVDVAYREAKGKKWGYDLESKMLYIFSGDSSAARVVVSGRNTDGLVSIRGARRPEDGDEGGGAAGDDVAFVISNLYLRAAGDAVAAPISATNGTMTVCLAGTNLLDAVNTDSYAGLNVMPPATLVITNLEESAMLQAYSGEDAAAIGGNQKEGTGTIRINGGFITAVAKETGAGIGTGYKYNRSSGDIYISGGRIVARGGRASSGLAHYSGAGVGGGDTTYIGSGRRIVISGGTLVAYGGSASSSRYAADIGAGYNGSGAYRIEITGGSVYPAVDGSSRQVYKVTLEGFTPNAKVEIEMPGYGTNDIYADYSGKVFLWLANGTYQSAVGGRRFATKVEGGTVTTIEIPDSYGVEVDGVDVASLSGEGWNYKVFESRLDVTNACVISGTNTEGKVNIFVHAAVGTAFTISNLCLKATSGSPITILHGTNTLCLAGTNTLDAADAAGRPGLHVAGMRQGVVVTNLHDGAKLVARGGANAAGIGADDSDYTGSITIAGGIVEAAGGAGGAGIGSGKIFGFYHIGVTGGTVIPTAGTDSKAIGCSPSCTSYITEENITFTGGSIEATADMVSGYQFYYTRPKNAAGDYVCPVTIPGFTPNGKVEMEIDGYDTYGIYADGGGNIHVWLAEGDYIFILGGVPHLAHVTSSGAAAEPWLSGVTANGTDVAYLRDESGKWRYTASNRRLSILSGTSPEDCVTVSGTNLEDFVRVVAMDNVYFAISNLNLHATNAAPISVMDNVTVAIAGDNQLDATAERGSYMPAALQMDVSGTLSLTNLTEDASLVANGGWAAAGIGTTREKSSTIYINIYGGTINARGGNGAAGIGSGFKSWTAVVNIYGGNIKAVGVCQGAGIGGGAYSTGSVNIYGGVVDASCYVDPDYYYSYGGAGIGGGAYAFGTVYIRGGKVRAVGSNYSASIGGGRTKAGYVYVSGGTVVPTVPASSARCIGDGAGNTSVPGEVRFTGGSIDAAFAIVNPAATNSIGVAVYPVAVSNLTANAKVAFDGLPSYYGTTDIYANEEGKVYLWLPEDWDEGGITPRLLAASPRRLLGATPGASHTFSANGYSYTVSIPAGGGEAVAERGEALELSELKITGFSVADGWIVISVNASPATWMYGFGDLNAYVKTLTDKPVKVSIYQYNADHELIHSDDDDAVLELPGWELILEDGDNATFAVPLGDLPESMFFKVKVKEN